MRIACVRMEHGPFGVDTPEDLERARTLLMRRTARAHGPTLMTIAFQGVPGAYSDLACRNAYPAMATLPCLSFEAAIDAVREWTGDARDAAVREQPGRARVRHPLAAAGIRPVHRRRAVPTGGALFARGEGAAIGDLKRAHSHTVALGQVRRILADLRLTAGGRGGYRRCGSACCGVGAEGGGGDRLVAGGGDLWVGDPAAECGGRGAQHDPVLRRRAAAGPGRSGDAEPDDDVRLPRPQRAGGACTRHWAGSRPTAST